MHRTKLLYNLDWNPLGARFTCISSSNLEFCSSNATIRLYLIQLKSFTSFFAELSNTFVNSNENWKRCDTLVVVLLINTTGMTVYSMFSFWIFGDFREFAIRNFDKIHEQKWNWIVAFVYSIDGCSVGKFSFYMLLDNNWKEKNGFYEINAFACLHISNKRIWCSVFVRWA